MFTRSILILVLAGVLTGAPALAQRPSKVAVDPVVTETMQQKMAILGRFVARSGGSVAARVAERVREIEVEVGDRVAAGAVLVRLADDRLAAQRQLRVAASRRAEAKAARMAAALAKAKQGLARLTKLRGSTADRPDRREDLERDVEKATSELSEARAEIDVAKAQLKLAQIALDDAVIRAPYSGVVTLRHVEVGTFVRTGEPVVTLLDDRDLEIEADVPAERLRGLTPNSLVEARLANGTPITAMVRAVVPAENPRTRSRAVRLMPALDANLEALADQQSVTVMIPIGSSHEVVTVHKDAVNVQGPKRLVYIAVDGTAEVRPVQLGEAVGDRFIVRRGLKVGDQAIIRGNERLRPKAKIIVGKRS